MSSFVKASGNMMSNSADPGEEFPFLHTITVVDRVLSVDKPELVQNNIRTETVTLNLDSEWEGLSTVINIGNMDPVSVIWSGKPVVIPAELMTTVGSLDVSVVGYGDDGGIRAVTKQAQSIFNVVASGFVEGNEPVPDPTTILGQLIEAANRANQAADRADQKTYNIANTNVETRLNVHDIVAQTYDATATAPVAYSPASGPDSAFDMQSGYAYVFKWNTTSPKICEYERRFITWIELYLSSNGGGSFSIGWADDGFTTAESALTVNVPDNAQPTLTRVNLPQYPGHGRLFIRPKTGSVKVSSSNSGNAVFSNIIDATNGSSGSTKKVWNRVGLTIKPDFTTASSLTFNRYVNELVLNRVMSINSNDVLTDDTIDKVDALHAQRWWTFKPSALEGHTTISFYLTADVSGDFLMGFTSISNPSWDDLVTYHYPSKAGWYTFPMPVANPTYSDPVFLVKAVRSNRFPLACHSRRVTADDEIYDITGAFGSTDTLAYAPSMKPNAGDGTYGVPYARIGDLQSIVPVSKSNMKNTLTWPNVIWDATSLIGMKLSGLWMDYMYDGRSDVLEFSNVNGQSDVWTPDVPESGNGIKCTPITLDIHNHNGEQAWKPLSFNYVSVRNEVRPQPIRILIIGDSVTSGAITSEPYWSVAARCFMRDDAAHNRYSTESTRSNVLFLGTYRDGENAVREVNDTFNGQALSTRIAVCAQSGSSLNNWLRNTRSGIDYGFYDGTKFSIKRWLGLYRNYNDDGTPMSWGDEGLGSLITEENINKKICATPNVVMIVHCHNGGSISEYETIIDEIRSEYPNMPIIVGAAMPLLGSWNKQLYRDRYDIGSSVINRGPQYNWGGNNGTGRVNGATNWINVEAGKNSSNGKRYENVWFFPMCVTTPTLEAVKTNGTISNGVREVKTFQSNGLPIEHPNYNAHFNWGVDLYGMLSWMFRDPSNPTNISENNPIIPNIPKVPVESISISPSSPTVKENGTLRLSATVNPTNATDRTVSWSSRDNQTATVTSDGTVTGIKQGSTRITATANDGSNVSSSVTLTVTAKPTGQGPLALFGDSQLITDSDTSLNNMGPYPSGANPGTATSWPSDQSKQIASITDMRVLDLYYGGARIARDKTGWQGGWAMQSNRLASLVKADAANTPEVILIYGFYSNDLLDSYTDTKPATDLSKIAATYRAKFAALKAAYPNARIIYALQCMFQSDLTLGKSPITSGLPEGTDMTNAYKTLQSSERILFTSTSLGVEIMDCTDEVWALGKGLTVSDMVHPNGAGAVKLGQIIGRKLEQAIQQ